MKAPLLFIRSLLLTRFAPLELGKRGERRARWSYRLRGYSIVATNVRSADGEIDFVARRGRTIVFVEVKSRQQRHAGAPYEAVTRAKQLQVARLAQRWLHEQGDGSSLVRFDVVSLFWSGWRFEVERFENAFELASDPDRPWRWK